uniref:Uncharacterized protein n=1 Tax=Alexandrium catenella TaxID=2925 RepID=A0A7S1QDF0_ALECA
MTPKRAPPGLPDFTPEMRDAEAARARQMAAALLLVPRLVCFLVAYLILRFGDTEYYEAQIAFFNGLTGTRWGYLFLAVVVFSALTSWLNVMPIVLQARVMGIRDSNLSANMYIYRVSHVANSRGKVPYVLLEEDGPEGQYNRASRSMHQFIEWAIAVALCIPFAGVIFPAWAFVLTLIFAAGRIWHQWSYVDRGAGGHRGGFLMAIFSSALLEMLVLVVSLRVFGAL